MSLNLIWVDYLLIYQLCVKLFLCEAGLQIGGWAAAASFSSCCALERVDCCKILLAGGLNRAEIDLFDDDAP